MNVHLSFDPANPGDVEALQRITAGLTGSTAEVSVAPAAPAPAKKAAAPKKADPEPEPAPAPEPVAEEVAVEVPETPAVDVPTEGATLEDATAAATELINNNQAAKVKAALDAVGASRVSTIDADKVGEFLAALKG